MDAHVSGRFDILRTEVEAGLRAITPQDRSLSLYEAVTYVMESGGKRLRPLLVLTAAEAFGAERHAAMPAALAVEVFHNFTLVHDDIMDQSESRRGRQTVHVRWNVPIGILAGDFLLAMSFDLLTRLDESVMAVALARFDRMVVRLCEGQSLDTEFESRQTVSSEEYLDMVSRKTGALLEVSLALGGLVAGVSEPDLSLMEVVGRHAGCAFQIQDDLLDLTADPEDWGKPLGGDLVSGKKSYLTVKALERERRTGKSWFSARLLAGGVSSAEVPEARVRLEEMGVLQDAEEQIAKHYRSSLDALAVIERKGDFSDLNWIIERLVTRTV
ncbi:MAG: polyprenyl synthetase family protein [Rhodothermia bacterium]